MQVALVVTTNSLPMSGFPQALEQFLSPRQLEIIRATRVGIAGAGGLGSNVAMMLTRCGFAGFVVADFDAVVTSNLNRQFFFGDQIGRPKVEALRENLQRINPDCQVQTHCLRVDTSNIAELYADCPVLVEAFDGVESKMEFVQRVRSLWPSRFLVTASGLAGWGNADSVRTRAVHPNFVIVGDENTSVDTAPPMAPRVMLAAAKQADAVLSFVLRNEK